MIPVIRLVFHCCHLQNDCSIARYACGAKNRGAVKYFLGQTSLNLGHSAFRRKSYHLLKKKKKKRRKEVVSLKPCEKTSEKNFYFLWKCDRTFSIHGTWLIREYSALKSNNEWNEKFISWTSLKKEINITLSGIKKPS